MQSSDDIDEAREQARAALNLMALHKVPATPANYAIWYTYQAGSNPELCRDLDRLICSMAPFAPARSEEIFERHFGCRSEGDAIRETGERISGVLGRALAEFESAGRDGTTLKDTLAAAVAEMSRLRGQLDDVLLEAMTDTLTGLANRKAFDHRLREEVAGLWKSGGRLSLVLADIDRFKSLRNTYGHRVGDAVLHTLGRTLRDAVRGHDTPARFGGEEFAIILPDTALTDAFEVAEQIRTLLARCEARNMETGERYGRVTLSFGVAQYRLGEPPDELIRRARRALCRAKRAGRNRVTAESTGESGFPLAG